jgi:thiol-disulfide isomerase/thioredoxin
LSQRVIIENVKTMDMTTSSIQRNRCWVALLLLATGVLHFSVAAQNWGTNENFSAVGVAVVKLLESGDAPAFARTLSPDWEDWRAANATNHVSEKSLARERNSLEVSARQLLAKAAELKIDFSKVRVLVARIVPPRILSNIRYEGMKESLTYAEQLTFLLSAEPLQDDDKRLAGEYKLIVRNLMKFPGGWRCTEGVQWAGFPTTVADEKVQRETAILEKAASHKALTQDEDPALGRLADILARCLRERDIAIFESDALFSFDVLLGMMKKQATEEGEKLPSRGTLEKEFKKHRESIVKPARGMLELMEQAGINFKEAEIKVKSAEFKSLYPRGGAGVMDGLEGNDLTITLAVESDAKSRTGKSLSGDYVFGAEECMRVGDRWYVSQNLHWKQLPTGALDEKAAAAVEVERYVAEHNTLPPGSAAPEIEFVRMSDEQKMKLADLRGKVVVLDFWATWCGPCQGPMAEMQKFRDTHPSWSNRVELVPLSIDDALKTVRNHVVKRGWTNTFNVWAGPGGWASGPAQKFRVTGVPTCYVIDAEGKIAVAGHPMGMQVPQKVDELLARVRPKP